MRKKPFSTSVRLTLMGDELWEEGDVEGIVEEVALVVELAAVDVDGVTQQLEGIEGDADGQEDVEAVEV